MADNNSTAPNKRVILARPATASKQSTAPATSTSDSTSSTASSSTNSNVKAIKQRDKVPTILQRNAPVVDADTGGGTVASTQSSMESLSIASKSNPKILQPNAPSVAQILQPSGSPGDEALTLIDNSFKFVADFEFMTPNQRTSMDFLVVTAIGPKASGKSTILSYLSGKANFGEKLTFLSRKGEEMKSTVLVSPDNVIFIEVASVLNGSAAMELGHYGSMESNTISWNLRLMRWALSVSHVVIIVSESIVDPNLCRLITSAEMIHPMESAFEEGAYPELIFVCNKVPLSYIDDLSLAEEVERMLRNVIGRPPRISPSLFLLPHTKYNYGPTESQRYDELKKKLYEFNRYNRSPFSEEIEGKPKIGQKISVWEWLSFASRLWEEMDQPTFFSAYAKLLP